MTAREQEQQQMGRRTRRVFTPGFGMSLQVWSDERGAWLHLAFEQQSKDAPTVEQGTDSEALRVQAERAAADVINLFDYLSAELYYGFNFRMMLMSLNESDYETLWSIARRARSERKAGAE